jgi:transcriptional regulator GlxA family with amidase domain
MNMPKSPHPSRPLRIDLLVTPNGSPSALGVASDLFALANDLADDGQLFDVHTCSTTGGTVGLRGRISVDTERCGAPADAVLVNGIGSVTAREMHDRLESRDLRDSARWVSELPDRTQLMAACTATFVLGAAGVLDERECTTTWWMADVFRETFPDARLDPDLVTAVDGRCWTAGASFSLIPMVLAFIGQHSSQSLVDTIARRTAHHAGGNQAVHRFPVPQWHHDALIADLEAFVTANLNRRIPLSELASQLHTTPRTLHRRTRAITGGSPGHLIQRLRVDEAVRLLRNTTLPVNTIARMVGLSDQTSLYRSVKSITGNNPTAFRRAVR